MIIDDLDTGEESADEEFQPDDEPSSGSDNDNFVVDGEREAWTVQNQDTGSWQLCR